MPAAADVGFLLSFLADLGDFRMAVNGLEKAIDIDAAKTPGKGDVLLGCQALIAKEDDREFDKGPPDLRKYRLRQGPRQINSADFGAKTGADRIDADMPIVADGWGFDLR